MILRQRSSAMPCLIQFIMTLPVESRSQQYVDIDMEFLGNGYKDILEMKTYNSQSNSRHSVRNSSSTKPISSASLLSETKISHPKPRPIFSTTPPLCLITCTQSLELPKKTHPRCAPSDMANARDARNQFLGSKDPRTCVVIWGRRGVLGRLDGTKSQGHHRDVGSALKPS